MPSPTKRTSSTGRSRPSTSRKSAKTGSSTTRSPRKRTATRPARSTDGAEGPIEITNYASAMRWLNSHVDHERMRIVRYNQDTFNLERMRKLLKAIGNPHQQLRFVHIAGSKGKGSVVAMLGNMLQACGYTIGTYTSPHLVDLRERIQINSQMIAHADFIEICKQVREKADASGPGRPTFFEIMTAAAFRHFADQAVDLAVIETGLGGRLDSTNVITPEVTGITHISYDHTNILGTTLAQIATEKAGIFKQDVPAVTIEQEPEAEKALRAVAEQAGAPLQVTGKDIEFSYRFEANRELGPHTRVCLTSEGSAYDHLPVPLQGEHQALNCGLALAILDKLRQKGFRTPEEKLTEGLANTHLPGRMELVWKEPRILLDGAHNSASIQALIRAVGAHVPYDSLVVVMGCSEDKDISGMLKQISLGADKVIFTETRSNPRSVPPEELMTRFNEQSGKMAQTARNLEDALNLAARAVSREDLICVTGSFYLVGEAKKYLGDLAAKRAKQNGAA